MTLCTKIQQFIDLEDSLGKEVKRILRPITAEVKLRDKKFILGPPVENTLSVKWLVTHPKRSFPGLFHYYLVLSVQAAQETGELNLVISSRQADLSEEIFLETYQESFSSFAQKPHDLTTHRILSERLVAEVEKCEEEFECSEEYEFYRFFLNRDINPAVVAKKIMTVAWKIYESQRESP